MESVYQERCRRFQAEKEDLDRRALLFSHGRLITFLAATTALVAGLWKLSAPQFILVGGGVALFALYGVLVVRHDRVLKARNRAAGLLAINQETIARLNRDWQKMPDLPVPAVLAEDPVAVDLDLTASRPGHASLYRLLGTPNTPNGRTTLAEWLVRPAPPDVIRARQTAVTELAPELDWRQELALASREMARLPPNPEPFFIWAEGKPSLSGNPALIWAPRLLALGTLTLLSLNLVGLLPAWWLLAGLFNLLFSAAFGRRAHETFSQVSWRERSFHQYGALFRLLTEASHESPELRRLHEELRSEGLSAWIQMKRLDRLGRWADARNSGLLHLILQALTLWDFHVWLGFERWQQQVGPQVRRWFGVLGEVEALGAFAALLHDHPRYSFPVIDVDGEPEIRAVGLGHPLLDPSAVVVNDVSTGTPGTFLLVTGSNMSGKSTLLRTIGVNTVLAQAGAPVFAEAMTLPPVRLGTSFRVQDALDAGVSFFMAELQRLKEIVDQARDDRANGQRTLLFLLDEILQGTNATERHIAVRRVIVHLLGQRAIGAVSTHDLSLADAEDLAEHCLPFHFSEAYETGPDGPRMRFDYRLRSGVTTTRNALKLLEMVGLVAD